MKKTLELLLCVCMLIGLLAGCRGGSGKSGLEKAGGGPQGAAPAGAYRRGCIGC